MPSVATPTEQFTEHDIFVAPDGDDNWSGGRAEPAEDGSDGPFATVGRAKREIRERRDYAGLHEGTTVWLRDGRYQLEEPLQFDHSDSAPVTYAAYPGEQPVIDGGRRIEGWEETEVNGVAAWVTHLPEVERGEWEFRQLFVNGERRQRTRLPEDPGEFYRIDDVPGTRVDADLFEGQGADEFICEDVKDWENLPDVDVVVLHKWIEERFPVESFDPETNLVTSSRRSIFSLTDGYRHDYARYYVENVFEALSDPGEWYLDTKAGDLYYVPRGGENPDSAAVYAPVLPQLVEIEGDAESGECVENLRFEGLTFRHGAGPHPTGGLEDWEREGVEYAAATQSAFNVPAVISLDSARSCSIENCTIEHVGWHGVELNHGCQHNRVVGNEIRDLGAGGVTLVGSTPSGSRALRTGHNRVTDNHIHGGGRIFHSAVGVLARHTFDNDISHNHIHDLYWTGISSGWVWGYGESITSDNVIEGNHIHELGQGLLSEVGGVYTLGEQPGTVIRNNRIHDIEAETFGGFALFIDEGTSHVWIEKNLCYDTTYQPVRQHYGRANVIRNNVFAFGDRGGVGLGRTELNDNYAEKRRSRDVHDEEPATVALSTGERGKAFTFLKNVVITDGEPAFVGYDRKYEGQLEKRPFYSDLNLLWDVSDGEPRLANGCYGDDGEWEWTREFTLDEWRETGNDGNSIVADPECADLDSFEFELAAESPARDVGFEPLDLSDVGPRPPEDRS